MLRLPPDPGRITPNSAPLMSTAEAEPALEADLFEARLLKLWFPLGEAELELNSERSLPANLSTRGLV